MKIELINQSVAAAILFCSFKTLDRFRKLLSIEIDAVRIVDSAPIGPQDFARDRFNLAEYREELNTKFVAIECPICNQPRNPITADSKVPFPFIKKQERIGEGC